MNFESFTCHSRRQRGIIECTEDNGVHQNESHETRKTFLVTQFWTPVNLDQKWAVTGQNWTV